MARRNRKKRMDGFMFPVPFAGFVVAASTLALGYVWLGCRCDSLGSDIRELEKESIALNKAYLNEEYRWTRIKSPRNIERALAAHGIQMTWPRRDQVVRLYETGEPGRGAVAEVAALGRP